MTDKVDKMSRYAAESKDPQSSGDYPEKVTIRKDQPNPIRIVDTPDGVERFYEAWMLCDDDVKRPFVIENDSEGKSILLQILGDRDHFYKGGILESIKDEVTKKGKYIWEDKDPELFLRIAYNNDLTGKEGSWKPRETYGFNGIQRNPDVDDSGNMSYWCKEHKHTKLLEMGSMAYKSLQDVRLNDGEPSEYDINYLKKGEGFKTQHNILKAGTTVPNVVVGPLSEEEKAYERYSLTDRVALTSPADILKYLRNSIARIDSICGTSWIQKLEGSTCVDTSKQDKVASQEIATPQPAVTSQPIVTSRTPVRETTDVETEECGYCHKQVAKDSEVCPLCGNKLLEPCIKCKQPFSVFATVCPSCGKKYSVK